MFAKIRIGKIADFSLTNIVYCIIDLCITVLWVLLHYVRGFLTGIEIAGLKRIRED